MRAVGRGCQVPWLCSFFEFTCASHASASADGCGCGPADDDSDNGGDSPARCAGATSYRPDLAELARKNAEFREFTKPVPGLLGEDGGEEPSGKVTINWKDPYALRSLTKASLLEDFGIEWQLPIQHLCPRLPARVSYLAWVRELLESRLPQAFPGAPLRSPPRGLDIGTGASCIYALLGHRCVCVCLCLCLPACLPVCLPACLPACFLWFAATTTVLMFR